MSTPATLPSASRAAWLKNLHRWHWISSALCLMGMLLFSLTGITLNHATQIEARPAVSKRKATLPAPLRRDLEQAASRHADARAPLPPRVAGWAEREFGLDLGANDAEWTGEDAYVALPRPGGDAWLRIAVDGAAEFEKTDRGMVSWLNDLHKGRNAGPVWGWFIDMFALACVVFSLTGFLIMKLHAANRPSTWPVIGAGILLPLLLALLFTH
ncbi:PepSY-associated TM helix domain-containing protein [Massilia genomosp. 1]|uniref:Peptidase n=1 Tax=Massilia genomosp. 1 TaxID=2609280 RepID=A0ABX0MRX6_9BURK|nr:PepSY-associated TM helix domain-containing protein [Massilia genomosp. 1]NHZ63340.1 hypothetical protein [Massilia genomosp. 1]